MSEKPPVFNPNIPIVHSISGYALQKAGFIKFGIHLPEGRQVIITTYKRGEEIVTYDGVNFTFSGKRIEFMEDLK